MHLDTTSLRGLDRAAAGGKRLGALWGYVGDENVAAYLSTSTGKKTTETGRARARGQARQPRRLHGRRRLEPLRASFKRADLIECGRNMHGRRYFAKISF